MAMNNLFEKRQNQFYAYLNMARHNAYMTLQYISRIMDYKEGADKENALYAMQPVLKVTSESSPVKRMFLLKQLEHFFPVIKVMAVCEKKPGQRELYTPSAVKDVLSNIFYVINHMRNKASHLNYVDEDDKDEKYLEKERRVVYYLNHCFTVSLRTVRARFGKSPEDMRVFTRDRYKVVHRKDSVSMELNHRFAYSMVSEDERLSDIGLVFLIALFLEKRYASIFFDSLKCDGKSFFYGMLDESGKSVLREAFSVFRIRLPRERLRSESDEYSLALDMFNELKKAPEELFEHLKPEDQDKFRVISSEGDSVLLKRYGDRFPSFVMRYIDEKKIFGNIRFQANIGKYRYLKKVDKHCINDEVNVRVLQKDINAFGRIKALEDARTGRVNVWRSRGLVKSHDEITGNDISVLPYITDSAAKYIFNNDRIGLFWPPERVDVKTPLPLKNGSCIPEVEDGNVVRCIQPNCWLSVYELPAMIFSILLDGSGAATEKIIKDEVGKYKRLFNDIAEGNITKIKCRDLKHPQKDEYRCIEEHYGIKWRNIPDKVRDFLTSRTRQGFNVRAAEIVREEILSTDNLIKAFEERVSKVSGRDNKMGKRSFVEIRPGRLAASIMKDVMDMQPSALKGEAKGRDKLTGMNYSILTAELAMYNMKNGDDAYARLRKMFEKAGLTGNSGNRHPFLDNVLNRMPKDAVDFYGYYLECKSAWLKDLLAKKDFKSANFLRPDRLKWSNRNAEYYKELAKRYLSQPFELPRGLFEEHITDKLIQLCGETKEFSGFKRQLEDSRNGTGVRINVAYMIMRYHELFTGDSVQPFYAWDRGYRIIDLFEGKKCFMPSDAITNYDYLSYAKKSGLPDVEKIKKLRKELDGNEKAVRRFKVQDILLFHMAKKLITVKEKDFENSKLGGISPDNDSVLGKQIGFSLRIVLSDGKELCISQDSIKLKNCGDFYVYLYDSRVKTLLPQIKNSDIKREELDKELMHYDLSRPDVCQLVLDFEKSMYARFPEISGQRYGFKDLLEKLEEADPFVKDRIRVVRNAFSHNEYPDFKGTDYQIPEVAVEIKKLFETEIKSIV